jgi:hypothetical protein
VKIVDILLLCKRENIRIYDVQESVHREIIVKITNDMQLYKLIYYYKSALNVSGDIFAHHQEHLTVFTVSGIVHPSCCVRIQDTSQQELG